MSACTHTQCTEQVIGAVAAHRARATPRYPKPETRNLKPELRNPEPGTRNPTPGTRNPEPGIRVHANSHGARPVHQIPSMINWIRTSRLPIKKSLSAVAEDAGGDGLRALPRPQPRFVDCDFVIDSGLVG